MAVALTTENGGPSTRNFAALVAITAIPLALTSCAHPQFGAGPSHHTVSVTASGTVTVKSNLAVLHIGFDTPPEDAKSAYADGVRVSNRIVAAIRQAGIPESAIRSEWQGLDRNWEKPHKFTLAQQWTVKVPPERAAEILDIAVSAGATSSGQIEWTLKNEKALDDEALDQAAARARENAAVLAKGMGVQLGALVSASNQILEPRFPNMLAGMEVAKQAASQMAIEPQKVTRNASVYAVYAIE